MVLIDTLLIVLAVWLIASAAINFSKNPHWYVRLWDFPRVLVLAATLVLAAALAVRMHHTAWHAALLGGLAGVAGRQVQLIYPYTRLARQEVLRTDRPWGDHCLRLVISNVLKENADHARWLRVVRAADPDVLVAVEVDAVWDAALAPLAGDYPHHVRRPQDNYYGMAVYSRLPFDGPPDVRFAVHDDVPSVHLTLRLRDGQRVRLHALHPRPPEPIRDQDSAARDKELVLLAKHIDATQRGTPTIVCGDLNDVAWSFTTQLFLRVSGLLDPRKGRGAYSSFHAQHRLMRFPLDHVFHSNELRLVELRRLDDVGSDHFPMMIALGCEPASADTHQPGPTPTAGDREDAAEIAAQPAPRGKDAR